MGKMGNTTTWIFCLLLLTTKSFGCAKAFRALLLTQDKNSAPVVLVPQDDPNAPELARANFEVPGKGRLVLEFTQDGIARIEYSPKTLLGIRKCSSNPDG